MKFMSKREIIIVLAIVLICLAAIFLPNFHSTNELYAEIYHYDRLIHTVNLSKGEPQLLNFPEAENVFLQVTEDGEIYFSESDCPHKICIHSGKLNDVGETAACLPNGILVKIVTQGDDTVDIIV